MSEQEQEEFPEQEVGTLADGTLLLYYLTELLENPIKLALFKFQIEYAAERAIEVLRALQGGGRDE